MNRISTPKVTEFQKAKLLLLKVIALSIKEALLLLIVIALLTF
jgi:hypothetical protein